MNLQGKISHTIIPTGWTGKDINSWYKHIHKQVSKTKKK